MNWRELVKKAEKRLSESGIAEAQNDAKELLLYVKKWRLSDYLLNENAEIGDGDREKVYEFEALIGKRAERVPLQHLTHEAWFFGRPFYVNESVLIPRFDTEILAEAALSLGRKMEASKEGTLSVLDLCTGSGCIGITIKAEEPQWEVTASDISAEALSVARKNAAEILRNAENTAPEAGVRFLESDLFEAITGKFDLIVSNPPYVTPGEIETLEPEVRDYDPRLALFGGADGLSFYRRIAREAAAHLNPSGALALEIGESQGEAVRQELLKNGFSEVRILEDLSGLDRVVTGLLETS